MLKTKLIITAIKTLLWVALLGAGIWYLSSALSGTSVTYTSLSGFMTAVGACGADGCNVANTHGCILCPFVEKLFGLIGNAAETFWTAIIDNIWIVVAIGFVIWLFMHTFKFFSEQNKLNVKMNTSERAFPFNVWWKKVQDLLIRILIVGAIIGGIGAAGTSAVKIASDVTITPVMFLGSELASAAVGTITGGATTTTTTTTATGTGTDNVMAPALSSFMTVIGNLNTVILAGAAGGFSLMNYAWMGLGGGMMTWIAGLALVLMFMIIGFNIFWRVLTVIIQIAFVIIFFPIWLAAFAFDKEWPMVGGMTKNAIGILTKAAVKIVGITLQVLILYAMVSYAADAYFPGPVDGYSAIVPSGLITSRPDVQTPTASSVMDVFITCENESHLDTGGVDKERFKSCFTIRKIQVEQQYPGAFDFMSDGVDFILLMLGIFLVYWYLVREKLDAMFGGSLFSDEGGNFDFGKSLKESATAIWRWPQSMLDNIGKAFGKKS